jgi:uncharacterized protein DUF6600
VRANNCAKFLLLVTLAAAGCGGASADTGYATTTSTYGYAAPTPSYSADVQVFYDDLAPYGRWVRHPTYGTVWVPSRSGYEPYSNGRWVYTDQGFTWVSDEPYGWTTTHYGHWVHDASLGWSWVPGRSWMTSNVAFYDAGDAIGWAPVGPDGHIYDENVHYVAYAQFTSPDIQRYYVRGDFRARSRRLEVLGPDVFRAHSIYISAQPIVVRRVNLDGSLSIAEQRRLLAEQRDLNDEIRRQQAARWEAERQNEAQRRAILARERAAEEPRTTRQDRAVDLEKKELLEHLRKLHEAELQRLLARLKTTEDREKADLDARHASARAYARLAERQNDRRQREIDELQRKQRDHTEEELRRVRAQVPGTVRY